MNVSLTKSERDFLLWQVPLPPDLLSIIHSGQPMGDRWVYKMDDENSDSIRDIVGERLQEIGFDKNSRPTPDGELLERLVDKFFIG